MLDNRVFDQKRCIGYDLSGADLAGKDLEKFDLERATFRGADLSEADLTGTEFIGAKIDSTDFSDALGMNLEGVKRMQRS